MGQNNQGKRKKICSIVICHVKFVKIFSSRELWMEWDDDYTMI